MNSSFMKDLVQKLKKKKNRCCCIYLTMTLKYNWDSIIWYMITNVSMTLWLLFFAFPVKKSTLFTKFVKSFSNFQISDARCFVQKFTQTFFFFFLAMSTSIIKGPITWFYASKCFTPLSQTSIGFWFFINFLRVDQAFS